MKKLLVITILWCMSVCIMSAQNIDVAQAQKNAEGDYCQHTRLLH